MEILKRYLPVLFFIASFAFLLKVFFLSSYPDFQVHYYGAKHILQRENPYLPDTHYFTSQVYPPFDMVFFIPLSFLPFEIASRVWVAFSIVFVIATVILINKLYKIHYLSPISLFLMSLLWLSFPLKFTLGMGQINAAILFMTTVAWYLYNKKRYVLSGIALAFPLMLKFFPLLFIPYFLYQTKWKLIWVAIFSTGALFLLTLIFIAFPIHITFFQQTLPDLISSWKGDYYNQSLSGVLMREVSDQGIRTILRFVIALSLLAVTAFAILFRRRVTNGRRNLEIASLIIVSLLINSFSWQHHFIFLLFPFLIIVYTLREKRQSIVYYIFLTVSYILVATNAKDSSILPSLVQSHVFFGALLLWIINMYLLIKNKV